MQALRNEVKRKKLVTSTTKICKIIREVLEALTAYDISSITLSW